jgi:hypothetical protein
MKKILLVVVVVVLLSVGIVFAADPKPESSVYWQDKLNALNAPYNAIMLEIRATNAEKNYLELLAKEYGEKLKAAQEREAKEVKKEKK